MLLECSASWSLRLISSDVKKLQVMKMWSYKLLVTHVSQPVAVVTSENVTKKLGVLGHFAYGTG